MDVQETRGQTGSCASYLTSSESRPSSLNRIPPVGPGAKHQRDFRDAQPYPASLKIACGSVLRLTHTKSVDYGSPYFNFDYCLAFFPLERLLVPAPACFLPSTQWRSFLS